MSSSNPGYKSQLVWAHLGKKQENEQRKNERKKKKERRHNYLFIYLSFQEDICLKDMFRLRSSTYFLRGHNMLCLPKPLTTSYGINSFSYLAATSWNSLPDHHRTISDFTSFRRLISTGNNNLLKRAGTANLSTSR